MATTITVFEGASYRVDEGEERAKPVRRLVCCVCGAATRGRRWRNRDTGFGICDPCVAWVRGRGQTDAGVLSYYGVAGVHYGVERA